MKKNDIADKIYKKKRFAGILIFIKRLFKEKPLGAFGLTITVIFLLVAIFAGQIAPYGINDTDTTSLFKPPGTHGHPLGTDNIGRDLLTRVIFGARTSVFVGLASATISVTIAVLIGVLSGYLGRKFDMIVQRFVDAILCMPAIILEMVVISMVGSGMFTIIFVLGIRSGIIMSRIIRSATISIKENTYIRAAIATGCTNTRIITKHIIPNIMSDIVIVFATRIPQLILAEASLSFLGFGVAPPTPSWGGMLGGSGLTFMFAAPWMVIWPGLALALLIYSVNMFADALRDLLDPKLRANSGASDFRLPTRRIIRRIMKGHILAVEQTRGGNNE